MKIEIDKPVIPQFVADYLRRAKADVTLMRVMELANTRDERLKWEKEYDWISANDETFARAWLYGYEVEEEPLYYAKVKGWKLAANENVYWNYHKLITVPKFGSVSVGTKELEGRDWFFNTKMTVEQWNKLGINDTNADFEVVSE